MMMSLTLSFSSGVSTSMPSRHNHTNRGCLPKTLSSIFLELSSVFRRVCAPGSGSKPEPCRQKPGWWQGKPARRWHRAHRLEALFLEHDVVSVFEARKYRIEKTAALSGVKEGTKNRVAAARPTDTVQMGKSRSTGVAAIFFDL